MKLLKQTRRDKGLTLDQMAKKLNISTSGYKKLEYGINKFTLARFIQVCKVLDLDVAEAIKEVAENE